MSQLLFYVDGGLASWLTCYLYSDQQRFGYIVPNQSRVQYLTLTTSTLEILANACTKTLKSREQLRMPKVSGSIYIHNPRYCQLLEPLDLTVSTRYLEFQHIQWHSRHRCTYHRITPATPQIIDLPIHSMHSQLYFALTRGAISKPSNRL